MRDLALKCILFAGAVALSCGLILLATSKPAEKGYLAAAIDKQRTLRQTPSPKLLLVGGSNLAFGVDSALIHERTGLPVVNMGLHGGLGLKYMLEEVKPYIREGDVIVVSPEYEHFFGDLLDGKQEVWQAVWLSKRNLQYVDSLDQYVAMAKSFPSFLGNRFQILCSPLLLFVWEHVSYGGQLELMYSRSGFNRYGDYVAHLGMPERQLPVFSKIRDTPLVEEAFSILAEFFRFVKRVGAEAIFSWPSIAETAYGVRKDQIQRIVIEMSKYPVISISGKPSEYVLPVDQFYDTEYHPNAEGRRKRTLKLLQALRENLKQ